MTNHQIEQIERYHAGQMNGEEVTAFEKQLASDPDLKMESDFQSDIISGLKEYRKTQLKARLDAVNIGTTVSWVGFVQQSTLIKSFGGIILASFIGAGIYLYGEKEETVESPTIARIDSPIAAPSSEYIWDLGEISSLKPNREADEVRKLTRSIAKNTKKIVAKKEIVPVKEELKEFNPSFQAPDVENIEEEKQFKSAGLDELPENNVSNVADEPIDVTTELSKGNSIKYKYYDGKLFLKGDFDKALYEILEINNGKGRNIYVCYLDKYYQVGITDQLRELPLVEDAGVIAKLAKLRSSK